jgi:hypothetical protein
MMIRSPLKFLLPLFLSVAPVWSWTTQNNSPQLHNSEQANNHHQSVSYTSSRRSVLDNLVTGAAAIVATGVAIPQISLAAVVDTDTVEFQRQKDKLSYTIKIPSTCKETQKPVRTHLDEVNFVSDQVKGYQYGVTVDPVRINSLREVRTEQNTSRR